MGYFLVIVSVMSRSLLVEVDVFVLTFAEFLAPVFILLLLLFRCLPLYDESDSTDEDGNSNEDALRYLFRCHSYYLKKVLQYHHLSHSGAWA